MRREDRRSDEELLAATATDAEAFAVFYRRHLRSVLAYLVHRTGRPDLAAPSAVGHAFLAVYDGDFPAGKLQITARLKNGKTWTQSSELGF